MNYLRNASRVLLMIVCLIFLCGICSLNAMKVESEQALQNDESSEDVYDPDYGMKIMYAVPAYDVEIVTVSTTEITTTTEKETETTTTEAETTTTEITTTTTKETTTKPKTTTTTTVRTTTTKPKTTTTTATTEQVETTTGTSNGTLPITQAEFYMLANLVAHEYGADWVSLHEKAKVVATVMNRVRMSRFPNTVREVILQRNQYCWVPDSYYWKRTTQSCKDAVTYYFNHKSEFSTSITSFRGNGRVNIFF